MNKFESRQRHFSYKNNQETIQKQNTLILGGDVYCQKLPAFLGYYVDKLDKIFLLHDNSTHRLFVTDSLRYTNKTDTLLGTVYVVEDHILEAMILHNKRQENKPFTRGYLARKMKTKLQLRHMKAILERKSKLQLT